MKIKIPINKTHWILIFSISWLTWSCHNSSLFDQNKEVDNSWSKNENLKFEFEVKDTLQPYSFYINLRNSVDYNYSNIFIFMTTTFPNKKIAIDTIECFLADPKGKWLGNGYGKYRDQQILFKENGRFPMAGKYQISIEQGSRETELKGLKSVGIRIVEYKRK